MRAPVRLLLPLLLACEPSWAQSIASHGGFIAGEVSYPSEYIPKDLTVCAEDIATKRNHCTSERQRDGASYRMSVPPGKFHVFAKTKDAPGVRAYYSEFVRCGLQARCS